MRNRVGSPSSRNRSATGTTRSSEASGGSTEVLDAAGMACRLKEKTPKVITTNVTTYEYLFICYMQQYRRSIAVALSECGKMRHLPAQTVLPVMHPVFDRAFAAHRDGRLD